MASLVPPGLAALSRHRRKRKTETSSDASDEAPERARNDAPKEVKLHEGSILFSRHSGEVSQASIRRFPCPQGRRSRGDRPTVRSRGTRDPTAAREICLPRQFEIVLRFVLAEIVYQKIRPTCEKICGILRRWVCANFVRVKPRKTREPAFAGHGKLVWIMPVGKVWSSVHHA